jgi:hypothetical protein
MTKRSESEDKYTGRVNTYFIKNKITSEVVRVI